MYADVHGKLDTEKLNAMHFITLVCDERIHRVRVYKKWGDFADKVVQGSNFSRLDLALTQNTYFIRYHNDHQFANMVLIDTSNLTAKETADRIHAYMMEQIALFEEGTKFETKR